MKSTSRIGKTMTMLEYYKYLINKISFDAGLLEKEYQKALKYLSPGDQVELKQWLKEKRMENQLN
ncbi:MAG: hypothetical protein KI791_07495 [Cyclobacteriaceae bacterium]|nr:hypothetical protein [Cyclobacteriaceae bacterium SS2]